LSTLAIERPAKNKTAGKSTIAYLGAAVFCLVFERIYSIFGHGAHSDSMSLMFLYPLLGGALPFLLLWLFAPQAGRNRFYRPACNIYNSGIAALTAGSALQGVFEIANTSSPYSIVFAAVGWIMAAAGALIYMAGFIASKLAICHIGNK